MMNSQAARFFLYEKWFKSWKKAEKKGKIKRKKLQKNFCLGASTWREEMPLIKVAYFMLNFLNLKSFLRHLFFWVASSLSMVCKGHKISESLITQNILLNQYPWETHLFIEFLLILCSKKNVIFQSCILHPSLLRYIGNFPLDICISLDTNHVSKKCWE